MDILKVITNQPSKEGGTREAKPQSYPSRLSSQTGSQTNSSAVMLETLKSKKPKVQYSRKGCSQCKKSHIKCDKIQPLCTTCAKKNILCTYELSFVFEDGSSKRKILKRMPKTKKKRSQEIVTPLSLASNSTSSLSTSSRSQSLSQLLPAVAILHAEQECVRGHVRRASVDDTSDAQNQRSSTTSAGISNFSFDSDQFDIQNFLDTSPADLILFDNAEFELNAWSEQPAHAGWKIFTFDWRDADWPEVMKLLEVYDPIQHGSPVSQPCAPTDLGIDPSELNRFVWTMARSTQLFGNFAIFPNDKMEDLINVLWIINMHYGVVQDALTYGCGVFIKDVYERANYQTFAYHWGMIVMSSKASVSFELLNAQLLKAVVFTDFVAVLFAYFLSIASNSTCERFEWDTYFPQGYHVIRHVRTLIPLSGCMSELERASISAFAVLEDWFCQAEVIAQVISDKGGALSESAELEYLLTKVPPLLTSYQDKYDLMKGCFHSFNTIFLKLCLKLMDLKSRGVPLGGRHMVEYKLLNTNTSLALELHEFGSALLDELAATQPSKTELRQVCSGIADHRLQHAMKNSHEMYFLGLQLYLKAVFMKTPLNSPELVELLEHMLEAGQNITYYSTKTVCCHLFAFLGAELALLIDNRSLFKSFMGLLKTIADGGTAAAKNSMRRLNYISLVLETRSYTLLVNPIYNNSIEL
ncbi:AaceriAGL361Cp [[Ashbya] aceris (nom. inval.)]|nr:AaceriAGL361Cp [[Ashbya] aceris (nom. inval.)]